MYQKMKKEKNVSVMKVVKAILVFFETVFVILCGAVSVLLCNSIRWMFQTWNHLTMDELVYQLNAPIEGTNQGMIEEYINTCIPGMILTVFLILALLFGVRKRCKIYQSVLGITLLLSISVSAYFVHMTWEKLDVADYSENKSSYSSFIDDNYVNPYAVNLEFPEQKRNLIYIFLESVEITYADKEDGGAFEQGCIPELVQLAQENEDFSGTEAALNGGYSMPSTTWTVAAMFAQSSGLPLSIPIERNSMNTQESFLPEAVTLGDILEKEGYSQTLFIGSDATFGGRRLLFTEHGNYAIKDYYYARDMGRLPEDYWVWWGYEDKRLFEAAKEELLETAAQDQPFNFTMLTVDTHFEDGYVCELCEDEFGENQYANVMACSSRQVAEFVKWIQEQDFYENTTIVISGDHPTMDSDFCEGIDSDYVRKVYTTYINSAVTPENPDNRRDYTTFDNFPTTLASIGVKIEGNRLGLGTNLFSQEPTLTEKYGREQVESDVVKQSKLMEELTSGIQQEQPVEQNVSPTATVTAMEYNYEIGALPVIITDFVNVPENVVSVNIAVWVNEDQSDLQWMQAEQQADGSYIMNINVPNFDYKTGDYHIDAYVVDEDGNQYLVGSTTGNVQ